MFEIKFNLDNLFKTINEINSLYCFPGDGSRKKLHSIFASEPTLKAIEKLIEIYPLTLSKTELPDEDTRFVLMGWAFKTIPSLPNDYLFVSHKIKE